MNAAVDHNLGLAAPPQAIESEQCILGGLLMDNRALDRILERVREADFYRADHRLIWRTIVRLIEAGKPADVITVYQTLQADGLVDDAGGLQYLHDLANNTPSSANIRGYADAVRDRALLRGLMAVGQQAIEAATTRRAGRPPAEVVREVESALSLVLEAGLAGDEATPSLVATLGEVREEIQYRMDHPEEISGLSTGLVDLDKALDGMQPADLIIVAGRSSMGKTALGFQIGQRASLQGAVVQAFSMEMPRRKLGRRMLANHAKLDGEAMKRGELNDAEMDRFEKAREQLATMKFEIDDRGNLSIGQMRARCRRTRRALGRLDLVIVDYLQLAKGEGDNRTQEVTSISRGLKALAKEMNCPVIALAQINRGVEQRQNKRPEMSDLRESGAIEQDADIILLLYRDEVYFPDSVNNKGLIEIEIKKNRDGALHRIYGSWLEWCTRIENTDRIYREPTRANAGAGFDG
jgi:replicative DNA helicase